jgi:hypothetical protein
MTLSPKMQAFVEKLPIRLILSVAAGIGASKVLMTITHFILHWSGLFPPMTDPLFDTHLLFISLTFHSVYAIAGAYITAGIAGESAKKAVIILGSKEAILWLLGTLLLWKHAPLWFNLTKAISGIPLAMIGGRIYLWKNDGREKETSPPKGSL